MKKMLRGLKRWCVGLINYFAWKKQFKIILTDPRKTNYVSNTDWYKRRKILLMVPHADDELISSYSILKYSEDVTVYYCGFTGQNKTDENRITRRKELFELCSIFGTKVIEGNGSCENLEDVLRHRNYDYVLLPSIADWHEEHRKISYMLNDICSNLNIAPIIFCYSVTVPNESENEVICIPLSKEQQAMKYDIFRRVYHSQSFMPVERLRLNERINGYHAGCYAAETFERFDYNKWADKVKKFKSLEGTKDSLLHIISISICDNMNNLLLLRRFAKVFYKWSEDL